MSKHMVTLFTTIVCIGAFGVAQAQAVEYVNHHKVESGENYFGPFVELGSASTFPYGSAIGCAGVRGVGLSCPPNSGEVGGIVLPFDVQSEPYIHNHSTFGSFFSGFYSK